MTSGMHTVIFPVKDIEAGKKPYKRLLGVAPYTDEPYYVGFRVGDQELGLDPNGHAKGMTGPIGYWHVDDVDAEVDTLVEAGGEVQQPPTDVSGGTLIATVKDADGNLLGLRQAGADG